jgi:glycosyltransferase involved in cell wall biosynthesis
VAAGVTGARAAAPRRAVAFVITGLDVGGAERQVVQLALAMSRRAWRTSVISLLEPRAFADDLRGAGVPVHSLRMRRGRADPRAIWRLLRVLRAERPAVVHSHMVHANLLARVVRPLAGVPVLVGTAHSVAEGGRAREVAYRATDFLGTLTTNVSRAGVERYVRVGAAPRRRIRFVPNGVDTGAFTPDAGVRARLRAELGAGARFVWLCVARMEHPKQHRELLAAFRRVLDGGARAMLLLAGQGPDRGVLERSCEALGIGDAVRFLGVRDDVPDLMRAADGLVLASAWEGLPMVLLEAGAAALPVVASDVGGVSEIVVEGETGLLVPPSDAAALADAMAAIAALDAAARAAMGAGARRVVLERYDLEQVASEWERLYEQLLDGRAGGGRHD